MIQNWDRMDTGSSQRRYQMSPRRDDRLALPALGEYYDDILTIDAWINNRSKVVQGQNLLCAKLQEREERIEKRIKYLADKRGISSDEMRLQILMGRAQRMSMEEVQQVADPGEEDEDDQ